MEKVMVGGGYNERGNEKKRCRTEKSLRERLPELLGLARGVRPEVDRAVEEGAQGGVLDLAGVDAVFCRVSFWEEEEVEVEKRAGAPRRNETKRRAATRKRKTN